MDFGESWLVSRVNVPAQHRGKGHGRQLMLQLTTWADREQQTLMLTVNPYADSPLKQAELTAWYLRCGFVQVVAQPAGLLVRLPQPPTAVEHAAGQVEESALPPAPLGPQGAW